MGPIGRCIVIGSSTGIGAEVAKQLSSLNQSVVCLSRRGTIPEPSTKGGDLTGIALDIRDYTRLREVMQELEATRPADTVVNCAGVGFFAPFDDPCSEAWESICDTNIKGLMNLLSVVRTELSTCSRLVHVGSLAALRPSSTPGNQLYTATKVAGKSLVDAFRREMRALRRNLMITHVCPGYVGETDFIHRFYEHQPHRATDLLSAFEPLSASQVASIITDIITRYSGFEISEIVMRPLGQLD
jgi:NADP-dependent 3-hydroxy acid dehydrogenase YdfG